MITGSLFGMDDQIRLPRPYRTPFHMGTVTFSSGVSVPKPPKKQVAQRMQCQLDELDRRARYILHNRRPGALGQGQGLTAKPSQRNLGTFLDQCSPTHEYLSLANTSVAEKVLSAARKKFDEQRALDATAEQNNGYLIGCGVSISDKDTL